MKRDDCSPHGGRRPDSFWMNDPKVVFSELSLKEGDIFLDLGCGVGRYSMHASYEVGVTGQVIAIDKNRLLLDEIKSSGEPYSNISYYSSDIIQPLPVETDTVDVCLICTVLHCFDLATQIDTLFTELFRTLKKTAKLVIIDCNLSDLSKGPPLHMRISSDDVEKAISPYGFTKTRELDLGFNYMVSFSKRN